MEKKYLVMESLKNAFFENKEQVIADYIGTKVNNGDYNYKVFSYTNGKNVIIDIDNCMAYTRNGFLFSVILKDDEYLNGLDENYWIDKLNNYYGNKYNPETDYDEEENEEEDE